MPSPSNPGERPSDRRLPDAAAPLSDGEVRLVVLLGPSSFAFSSQPDALEAHMDAFEQRARLVPGDRTDRYSHAAVRVRIAAGLRGPAAGALFLEILASGCLWLSLRHWSDAAAMRQGLDEQIARAGCAVITASVADPPPSGMRPDTAWAFMVGDRVHDGRGRLASVEPGTVQVVRPPDVA